MASPQIENGYTKIANELLDVVLRTTLPGRHVRVWLFVLRKTYGYGKKKDRISLSQFTKATYLSRSAVCQIINDLVLWKTLVRLNGVYAINKNYEQWVVPSRTHSPVEVNRVVLSRGHTKETITKEIDTFASQSVKLLKLNRKPMAFRAYDESNPTDDLPSVDADSGETAPVTQKKARDSVATRVSAYFFHRASEAVGKPLINQGYGYVKKFTKTAPEKVLMAVVDEYFDRDPSDPTNIYKCLNAKNINKVLSEI